ncbi:MAG: wzc [Ramlibacter sp.]|jgi:protein-tyrosine kinase|nr:wzc [Ramlibacter sp.]
MERIKFAIDRARQQAAASAANAPSGAAPASLASAAAGRHESTPTSDEILPLDRAHLERYRIVALDQDNPYRREFDLLRTQVLQKMQENGWRTIAVTSPSVQSGKTMIAANLALSIAHHPSRTALLVDFDLRRPCVAASLGLPPQRVSLNEVLAGTARLSDAILRVGIPRFQTLLTHRKIAGAAEMLASDKVSSIIASLRDDHPDRIVIFDLPPVAAVDDVIAVLPKVDCVLLVVASGASSRREIEESQRHLGRANILGTVINKVSDKLPQNDYY